MGGKREGREGREGLISQGTYFLSPDLYQVGGWLIQRAKITKKGKQRETKEKAGLKMHVFQKHVFLAGIHHSLALSIRKLLK